MALTYNKNRRNPEQFARRFLSTTFRQDTRECITRAPALTALNPTTYTHELTIQEVDGEWKEGSIALIISLFDAVRKVFFGASQRVPLSGDDATSSTTARTVLFHTIQSTAILVVYEVVAERDGKEFVSCWGNVPLPQITAPSIELHRGCAQLLYLDQNCLPRRTQSSLTFLKTSSRPRPDIDLSIVVPQGIFVNLALMEGGAPPFSLGRKPFRIVLKQLRLHTSTTATTNVARLVSDASWSCLALIHNTYKQLSAPQEIELEMESPEIFSSKKECVFKELPVHHTTALVLVFRNKNRGDVKPTVFGYGVFSLCGDGLKDCDLRVSNLPTLKGPFACEDPRCLSLESSNPYDPLPWCSSFNVSYYDTPIPALRIEPPKKETAPPSGGVQTMQQHVRAQEPAEQAAEQKPLTSATGETRAQPLPSTTQIPIQSPVSSKVPSQPQQPTTAPPASDLNMFKLLCSIKDELHAVKEAQEKLQTATRSNEGGGVNFPYLPQSLGTVPVPDARELSSRRQPSVRHAIQAPLQSSTVELPLPLLGASPEVVDLTPKNVGLSSVAREALRTFQDLPIINPSTSTRVVNGEPTQTPLPCSRIVIRVDAVSFSEVNVSQPPSQLLLVMSFGALPMQVVGPMHAIPLALPSNAPNDFSSMKCYRAVREGAGVENGFVWVEPETFLGAQLQLMEQFKSAGQVYIHIYDAVKRFYVATGHLKMSAVQRLPATAAIIECLTLPLQRDASFTYQAQSVAQNPIVFPVTANIGLLHLTVAAIGLPASPGRSCVTIATKTAHFLDAAPSLVVAKKLPLSDLETNPNPEKPLEQLKEPPSASTAAAGSQPPLSIAEKVTAMESKQHLHSMRVNYVKSLLASQQLPKGAMGPDKVESVLDTRELEFKLLYVEKRREEVKAQRIAEALRLRITTTVKGIEVSQGRPQPVFVLFTNPFPETVSFRAEIPLECQKRLILERTASGFFTLGPRETFSLPLYVAVNEPGDVGSFSLQCYVRSDKLELVRIVDIDCKSVPPIVDRRYELFGPSSLSIAKKLFSRAFSSIEASTSGKVTNEAETKEDIRGRLSALCSFCKIYDPLDCTEAQTIAALDPITTTCAVAWEEVVLKTRAPATGAGNVVRLFLYKDQDCLRLWETWEIVIEACAELQSPSALFGQTTHMHLLMDHETVYAQDPSLQVVEEDTKATTILIRPRERGTTTYLLHVFQQQKLLRVLLTVVCLWPSPTFEQVIEVSTQELQNPLIRRLQFVNYDTKQQIFKVHSNYKHLTSILPETFALAPKESQQITIRIEGPRLLSSGGGGRWPVWVFVNDQNDKTVESYLLQVVFRNAMSVALF